MNIEQYQQECLRTANFTGAETEIVCNMVMGVAGEAGEIVDYLKKVSFHGHHFEKDELIEEMGDLLWYVAVLTNYFNIDLEDVMKRNIIKLKERYPNGFDKQKSI